MDDAELLMRLRCNAQVCREEQGRDLPPGCKAELANNAREWDEAADRIESLSAVIARVEGLRLTSTLREYANMECPAWPHANAIDPEDRVENCEHCELHAVADKIEDQFRAALAERGANDNHE